MRRGCPRFKKDHMSGCTLSVKFWKSYRKSSIVKISMKQEFFPDFFEIQVQKKLPAGRIGGEISLDTNFSLGRYHRLNV